MGRGDGRSLGQRVGSAFENGFGDEGWDAKLIYYIIMAVLITCSGGLALLGLPFWLLRRAKRRLARNSNHA